MRKDERGKKKEKVEGRRAYHKKKNERRDRIKRNRINERKRERKEEKDK